MIVKKGSVPSGIKGDILIEQIPELTFDGGELFLTISEITNQAIFICDKEWNILFVNSRFTDILNYEKSDVLNRSLFDLMLNYNNGSKKEFIELQNGEISGFEILGTVYKSDYSEIKVNLSISVINRLNSAGYCFLGIMEDVSDMFRLQEEIINMNKMETVGQISGGIVHDFNNNLMGIMCCAEIIRNQIKDSNASEYADKMVKMVARASDLNISMLNFIKKGSSILKPCNLHSILEETLSMLQPSFRSKLLLYICHPKPKSLL